MLCQEFQTLKWKLLRSNRHPVTLLPLVHGGWLPLLLIGRFNYYKMGRKLFACVSQLNCKHRMTVQLLYWEVSHLNCILSGRVGCEFSNILSDGVKKSIEFHKLFVLKYIFSVQILSYFIEWKQKQTHRSMEQNRAQK